MLIPFLLQYRYNEDYHISTKQWGNNLVIINTNLSHSIVSNEHKVIFILNSEENFFTINSVVAKDDISKEVIYALNRQINACGPLEYPSSLNHLFGMTNHLSFVGDNETILLLIDLAMKKKSLEFLNKIFNDKYKSIFSKYFENFNSLDKVQTVNIINGMLFVTDNLGQFLQNVRNKGYEINTGPKKFSSQVNSLNNYLMCLDTDFRESLYNHNRHHVYKKGTIDKAYFLSRDIFSYRNIHMNIGSAGW